MLGQPVKVGNTGFVSLIDKQGNILAYPKKDKILTKLSGKGKEAEELIQTATALNKGFSRATILGLDGFVAYAPVKDRDWSVMATLPYDEFMSAPNTLRNTALGIFIIGGFVSFALAHNITSSLLKLVAVASKVGQGDFTQRVVVKSHDEVGVLALHFNKMVAELGNNIEREASIRSEEKVFTEKKKTDEIEALNQQLRANEQELIAANQKLQANEHELMVANQQLKADEQVLIKTHEELKKKVRDLELYKKVVVGREIKMIDLKKEINALLNDFGKKSKYKEIDGEQSKE